MSDYRELIQCNGLLFQGYFAYESQEYDEPLPGWSGHWNSQQDKQHEQFRVRQPQQKLAKHNMYAKAAAFSTAFYCEQVRCLLILHNCLWGYPQVCLFIANTVSELWLLSPRCVPLCICELICSPSQSLSRPKLGTCSQKDVTSLQSMLNLLVDGSIRKGMFLGCHQANFYWFALPFIIKFNLSTCVLFWLYEHVGRHA